MNGWIVFGVIALPLIGVIGWLLLDDALVRIDAGSVGLMLLKGRATDRTLEPGPHLVPSFRRLMVQTYPSLEMSYRAGEPVTNGQAQSAPDRADRHPSDLEQQGPPIRATLGDRSTVSVSFTVRCKITLKQLKTVHERFGPSGLWGAIRDATSREVRATLELPEIGLDDLFGPARHALEGTLAEAVRAALDANGFELTFFALGDLDLGRAGEVIQAAARARYELEREHAESETRLARARNDATLSPMLSAGYATDAAMRYREVDAWLDIGYAIADRGLVVPMPVRRVDPNSPQADVQAGGQDEPSVDTSA